MKTELYEELIFTSVSNDTTSEWWNQYLTDELLKYTSSELIKMTDNTDGYGDRMLRQIMDVWIMRLRELGVN
tara:strand:- start:1360 stop:1575 length:216 start_codon:yes stop_codon:yes gene_type:complete